MPIGIIPIKTNNKHKTGNFLMILNGYLKEFKTSFDKSIINSPTIYSDFATLLNFADFNVLF